MKAYGTAVALVATLLVYASTGVSADIASPGEPRYANSVMSDFVTPTVVPGDTVEFSFVVNNPYDDTVAVMDEVVLTVGIYKYATQEETRVVDSEFPNPPLISGLDIETEIDLGALEIGEARQIQLNISTSEDTPHGSYFSQSTYFVRFAVDFHFEGNATPVVLKSRGFFTDEQWEEMVSFEAGESIVNITYLRSLGIDGLLPDSSFGIKMPIPRWPMGALAGSCVFVSFLALYYFVLDNPGRYPKLEKRFYYLRGKLSQLRGKFKDRVRK